MRGSIERGGATQGEVEGRRDGGGASEELKEDSIFFFFFLFSNSQAFPCERDCLYIN